MIVRCVAAGVAFMATGHASQVEAAAPLGIYVGLGAGLALLDTQATTLDHLMGVAPSSRPVVAPRLRFDPGFALVGNVGYGLGDGIRVELESDSRRNSVAGGGTAQQYGVFANALYEFDLGESWISPYIGFGIGYQATARSSLRLRDPTGSVPIDVSSSTSGSFAYHAILGVALPVDAMPGLSVTAEYRYTGTIGSGSAAAIVGPPAGSAPARLHVAAAASHALIVGLRYAFEHITPRDGEDAGIIVPRAPIAGAVSRTYVVYFERDSTELTSRARDVVAEAARASTHVAHTHLSVAGHTDRTSTPERDIAISRVRADAVADELVRWGIARDVIDVHAFGDERLAVETAPGVREPRNRRVEILYR